jgi:hypothetical protein
MASWTEFLAQAPRIAEVFVRRHRATGNLCFLGTLRANGWPRISPMEPRIFEDRLVLIGMPNTWKFKDLLRDPRFSLHTATVDTHVGDGDAKIWGTVENVQDTALHERFAQDLFNESGFDLRGQRFDPFFVARLEGGSAVEFRDGQLTMTTWRAGQPESAGPLG